MKLPHPVPALCKGRVFEGMERDGMKTKIKLYKPKDFQDAIDAYDSEKKTKPWILDLSGTDAVTAQRIADFVEGLAYSDGGKVTRLTETMVAVVLGKAGGKFGSK